MPDDAGPYSNLGNVLLRLGRLEEAEQSHRRAVALNPEIAVVHSNLGCLLLALGRLEDGLARPEDAIVRDACIQRFEFTFEMAWRAIQSRARAEGVECVSPRDCFRAAFRLGLLGNDPRWLAMVEDRKFGVFPSHPFPIYEYFNFLQVIVASASLVTRVPFDME